MKIKTIIRIIAIMFVIVLTDINALVVMYDNERALIERGNEVTYAGEQLINTSNYLTNQARFYVVYGEEKYYNAYTKELSQDKTRDKVFSLLGEYREKYKNLDYDSAVAYITKAVELSDTLAQMESEAFMLAETGDLDTARQHLFGADYEECRTAADEAYNQFIEKLYDLTQVNAKNMRTTVLNLTISSLSLFVGIFIFVIISLRLIHKKIKLIGKLAEYSTEIAKGDVDIEVSAETKDEVGVLAKAFKNMLDGIKTQAALLDKMAGGDFSESISLRSEKDRMNKAINNLVDSYNGIMGEIQEVTAQVSAGSIQITDSAQILAYGSNHQAAAIEELSSSISEMEQKTQKNAQMAQNASSLTDTIKSNANKGTEQMEHMMKAVNDINDASNSISRIIKVIDDIAFQTNILALNAAVEASRAGEQGKGFAVVAEEVRNLAAKSAEAAKNTGTLISDSVDKAQLGKQIANETAASLSEIVTGINNSNVIIGEISASCEEQSLAITQINQGISEVAQVVQQNSATAQESSATSAEMNEQATILKQLLAKFKLKKA